MNILRTGPVPSRTPCGMGTVIPLSKSSRNRPAVAAETASRSAENSGV